jgi:hypothetical protein
MFDVPADELGFLIAVIVAIVFLVIVAAIAFRLWR